MAQHFVGGALYGYAGFSSNAMMAKLMTASYLKKNAHNIFAKYGTQATLSDIDELRSIEVFSIAGKNLGEIPLKLEGAIDLSAYPTGMYLIKLSYRNEKTAFTKLIKG